VKRDVLKRVISAVAGGSDGTGGENAGGTRSL
jgi:hypothetical protein